MGGEERHKTTDTSMVRTRKGLGAAGRAPPRMWKLGQGQAQELRARLGAPTSGLLDPPPDTTGPPVFITYKKFDSNLFH